jgi:ribosomal protein S27AE
MSASENLPPFTPYAACPKCGGSVETTWHLISLQDGFPCMDVRPPRHFEHLCRQCSRCGYGWLEATKDASASEPRRLRPAR